MQRHFGKVFTNFENVWTRLENVSTHLENVSTDRWKKLRPAHPWKIHPYGEIVLAVLKTMLPWYYDEDMRGGKVRKGANLCLVSAAVGVRLSEIDAPAFQALACQF